MGTVAESCAARGTNICSEEKCTLVGGVPTNNPLATCGLLQMLPKEIISDDLIYEEQVTRLGCIPFISCTK